MAIEPPHDAPKTPRPARSLEDGRSGRRERPSPVREGAPEVKPTPVREGVAGVPPTESETGASAGPVSEATSLVIDGVTWTVRVRGRGRLGADTGPAPLLVLGFSLAPEADVPDREALVVARALEELTPRQLERAFDVSRPPPAPGVRKELFPETATKGRKVDS